MCSNRAIVDSLECCMDDLVECFEDFVKKSLILIFVGIGVIVGLLCYLLKMVSERSPLNSSIFVPENTTHTRNEVDAVVNNKNNTKPQQEIDDMSNMLKKNEDIKTDKTDKTDKIDKTDKTDKIDNNRDTLETDLEKDTTAINASNVRMSPYSNENALREVGLSSCSKNACGGGSSTHIYTPSRVPIPSLPTSLSKHKLTPCIRKRSSNRSSVPSLQICPKLTTPGSCCSMCCYDEPK